MRNLRRLYKNIDGFIFGIGIITISAIINVFIPLYVKTVLESENVFIEILKLFSLILVQTILLATGNYILAKNGEKSINDLMKSCMDRLIDTPVQFFENEKSGSVTHKIIETFSEIRNFASRVIPNFISSIIIVFGSVTVLFILDWKLSVLLIISLTLLIVLLSLLSNYSSKSSAVFKTNTSNLSGKLAEYIQQIHLIKFSNAQNDIKDKLETDINSNYKVALKMIAVDAIVQPIIMLFFFIIIIGIFTYGAIRIQEQDLTLPVLISFLVYLIQLLTPFSQIGLFFNEYAKIKISFIFLDTINSNKSEHDLATENLKIEHVIPEILEVKNLSFSYDGENQILNDISFKGQCGEKIAIVGPSGSGKSTIFKVLEKLYMDYNGKIELNGIDINSYSVNDWRSLLSVVSQDTALLSLSIRDNLTLGLKDKENVNLNNALEKAQLLNEVNKLPKGLDTEIGERGVKLSGGQQQRLQIARAILKESPILLMDEPTSNLDSETEKMITESMNTLMKNKIAIIIAHRLSTIMDSDKIYFVENGKITGQGTHVELMEKHPKYKRFVTEQIIH